MNTHEKCEGMEMETNNPVIAKIITLNGTIRDVNASQSAAEVLKASINDDENLEDYALIFFGRKLESAQQLKDIPYLTEDRPIRMVRQKISSPKPSPKEIDELLKQCRNLYKTLVEEAYPPQISGESYQMLLTYVMENKCANYEKALKEFPHLPLDPLGNGVIRDWRLLIPALMENDKFAHEHPECLQIFKRALDKISAKYSSNSPFIRFGPSGLTAGPSHGGQVAGAALQPTITQQQLSRALEMALGGPSARPSQEQQVQPPPPYNAGIQQSQPDQQFFDNAAQNFSAQLQQMHDFGFTDDRENIQALLLCNGDVEQALQIVIATRD